MRQRRAGGFTLVELLVVIAIIGILVALLLPAIQAAREAARRSQCQNNIKQIGLAIHLFHDTKKALPPARIDCNHGTWAGEIWPYLEEGSVADLYDPELSYYFQPKQSIEAQVSVYLCPSRRIAPQLSVEGDDRPGVPTHVAGGLSDYAVSNGDGYDYVGVGKGESGNSGENPGDNKSIPNGAFRFGPRVADKCFGFDPMLRLKGGYVAVSNFKKMVDGLSKTIFAGEKHVPEIDPRDGSSAFGKKYTRDNSVYNPDYHRSFSRYGSAKVPIAIARDEPIANLDYAPFGSWHPGICQFLMGDSSVRSINSSLDGITLGRLTNVRDGEVIDASKFE